MIMYKNKNSGKVLLKKMFKELLKLISNDRDYDSEYFMYSPIKRRFMKNY